MSSYLDGLKGAVGGAVCFVADKLDSAATYTFGTPPGSIGGAACNNPSPPPPPQPPFNGGQCPNERYFVTFNFDTQPFDCALPASTGSTTRGAFFGPIRGIEIRDTGEFCGATHGREIWILHSQFGGGDAETRVLDGTGQPRFINPVITSVSRQDGDPDNCGDPPISPPEPPGQQPISFTYINNEGDDVTVEGDVNIGIPILIAPFTLIAPVTVTAGGIDFNGSVTLSPNFDVTLSPSFGGSGNGPGGGGGGDGEPTEPIPPDDEDPEDDEPDEPIACEDLPLKGLVVTLQFSEEMRATELIQDGTIPAIGVPRVAILYFIARMGNREVYMPGIDLKSRQQYVPVPFNSLVTCWRIHLESGVSVGSVRPIFDIPHS